jgi:hypothetical protein
MSVVTQLYLQIVEEDNYMFRPFCGWATIRLKLEYRRKLIQYNVDIKNGGKRSRFTMSGEVRSYTYAMWSLQIWFPTQYMPFRILPKLFP